MTTAAFQKCVNILLQELLWRHEKLAHKRLCFLRIIALMLSRMKALSSFIAMHCTMVSVQRLTWENRISHVWNRLTYTRTGVC